MHETPSLRQVCSCGTPLQVSSAPKPSATKPTAPGLEARVKELTDNRGADTIIEGVGHIDALRRGLIC